MYVWSPLKKDLLPGFARLNDAFKKADKEDREQRDVRPLKSAEIRLESINEKIKGHILTRRTAITSFGWNITAKDQGDKQKAIDASNRCEQVIKALLNWKVQTPLYDSMCVELSWDTNQIYGTTPRIVRRCYPVELEKEDDLHLNVLGDNLQVERIHELDLQDFNTEFIAEVDDSYERGGILRTLIRWAVMRDDMILEWGNFNKKLKGIIQAIVESDGDEDKKAATEQLINTIKNNFTVSGAGLEFQYHSLTEAGSQDSFNGLIQFFNTAASLAILGQANTTELPKQGGSRAALQVMKMISADIHYADIIASETLVNRLLKYDYFWNYGKEVSELPWEFKINLPEEIDLVERADFIAQLKQSGIAVKSDEVYSFLNLTKPENVQDILFGDESAPPELQTNEGGNAD